MTFSYIAGGRENGYKFLKRNFVSNSTPGLYPTNVPAHVWEGKTENNPSVLPQGTLVKRSAESPQWTPAFHSGQRQPFCTHQKYPKIEEALSVPVRDIPRQREPSAWRSELCPDRTEVRKVSHSVWNVHSPGTEEEIFSLYILYLIVFSLTNHGHIPALQKLRLIQSEILKTTICVFLK